MALVNEFLLALEIVVEGRLGNVECVCNLVERDVLCPLAPKGFRRFSNPCLPLELVLLIRTTDGVVPPRPLVARLVAERTRGLGSASMDWLIRLEVALC